MFISDNHKEINNNNNNNNRWIVTYLRLSLLLGGKARKVAEDQVLVLLVC
jgi:hypothetical protein